MHIRNGVLSRLLKALLLILSSQVMAEMHTFSFISDTSSDQPEILPLDRLGEWQYSLEGAEWKPVRIPFFFTDQQALRIRCVFSLDTTLTESPLQFVSHGFGCAARIYLKNNLIHTQKNDDAPFRLQLPRHYLNKRQKNEILFYLHHPVKAEHGFPVYPMLEKPPKFLGVTRPLYLRVAENDWVDNFRQNVRSIDQSVIVEYSYGIRLRRQDTDPIRIEERFYDNQNRIIYRRSFSYNPGTNPVSNTISIPLDHLWSAENPVKVRATILHLNKSNVALHQWRVTMGIRSLDVINEDVLLNGRSLQIRGINYHENILAHANGIYEKKLKNDILRMYRMGVNAIRFPHYIPPPYAVNLADSLGILLFAELPIWRYPVPLYKSDHLLESAKQTIQNLSEFYHNSPSFCGLSLGQQIPLHKPTIQKFMLILKRFAESNLNVLTTLSPIPGHAFPSEPAADLYVFESLASVQEIEMSENGFLLDGHISILPFLRKFQDEVGSGSRYQYLLLRDLKKTGNYNGGFIDAFSDYYTENASHISNLTETYPVMPVGLTQLNGEAKIWSRDLISDLWSDEANGQLEVDSPSKQSNLFSIIIFFATILFFIYYKQNLRFRDNLKRSLRHPYGFFVDMRERRIIPLFNSIIAGGYYSLVLAIFFASLVIFYNDSLYLQEFISALFEGTNLYTFFLETSRSLPYSILFCFLFFFSYPLIFSIVLKLFSLFAHSRIRFRQGLAIGFWSGAPFLFMAPVSLVTYRILDSYQAKEYLFYIFLFFIFWAHYRIINGIRVLFNSNFRKVFIILLLSYSIPLIIFWAILKPDQHWYDYLRLLLESQGLY